MVRGRVFSGLHPFSGLLPALVGALVLSVPQAAEAQVRPYRPGEPEAGRPGGPGLALKAAKVLTAAERGPQVFDRAVVLVRDGRIEAVGSRRDVTIPEDYERVDLGDQWLMPGMIDLHCHVAGESIFQVNDINDMVYMTNAGLRASAAVVPGIQAMRTALAGGVTTVLYIPGSGTNMGGQGVLLKTWPNRYEPSEVSNPGSLKLAQAGNPERWAIGVARSLMNWTIRDTFRRGLAHAREAKAGRDRDGVGRLDPDWEVFYHLLTRRIAVSTHTQMYQVVLTTITMVRIEFGLEVFLDHGTIGGWKAGGLAAKHGVPAIVGPRAVDPPSRGFAIITGQTEPGFRGVAAGYQQLGHTEVGFNTDSPIVPQEELSVQAAMGARHGFRDDALQVVRGLTIVPARAALIADRVGSLEVGKHADILAITGHPADPRSHVTRVWIEGAMAYEGRPGERLW